MKRMLVTLAVLVLSVSAFAGEIEVYFSPRGGCQDAIIQEIDAATEYVKVQAYSFTNADIAKALLNAHKRGVDVEVILDKSQRTARYSSATFFHNQGVPLLIDAEHAIAHNKIMLIDGGTIITGSFNFSKAAENVNAENLLVLKDFPEVYEEYLKNYQEHRAHSDEYKRPTSKRAPPEKADVSEDAGNTDNSEDPTVYVTRTGKKYHRGSCSYLRKSRIPAKLSEAKRQGYTPCSRCRPPE